MPGASSIDTTNGALTLGAVTGAGNSLSLDAGTGGAITGTTVAGVSDLVIVDGDSTTTAVGFSGAVTTTNSIDLNGTQGGTYTFDGLVTTPTLTTNAANDGNGVFALTLNGGTSITNAVAFDNTGALTLVGTPVDQVYVGGVDTTGVGGTVTVSGNVRTNGTGLVTAR